MQQISSSRLRLPRTYFESMVGADILIVYRGRMYTPIVAPSPEQATQYSAASLRLGGVEFVLEPLEKLTVLEDRYLNGRAMHPALQQYQHDYLASVGNAALSSDIQEEMLETALLRFVTDEVFPSFATSSRTIGRLLNKDFARVRHEDEAAGQAQRKRRERHGWDDGSYDFHNNRSTANDQQSHPAPTNSTRLLRALLNGDAEPATPQSQLESDLAAQDRTDIIQPPEGANIPPTLAAAHAAIDREQLARPIHPQAVPVVPPEMPTPDNPAPAAEPPRLESNFSRLLRHTVTTRTAEPPPPPPVAATPPDAGVTRVMLPLDTDAPAETARPAPQPGRQQARSGHRNGGNHGDRAGARQRGMTQPRLIQPPAAPPRQFSMVEQLLGLTNFAVIEGIIYTLQPTNAARPDVSMGNHGFSLRPYMLLADLLNHYTNQIAEMLRNEAKANQPAVQQLRQDRQHVEEVLHHNYGAVGLSLERINARSYFICLSIAPFANRGSDSKFYAFSGAVMREMARRAGMDVNTVRDPLKVAIQVTINWSARGFEKITASEPLMLGPAKGPFITWAREIAFHDGFVVDRDICTDNYQPPSHLSFGAGIANKLETARRIIMSGYILGSVRPRSLLTADGYAAFQVTPEWLRDHHVPVTNVPG